MTDNERILMDGVQRMADESPSVGLCAAPFRTILKELTRILAERDDLAAYRAPMKVNSYKLYAGQCPRCGVVFLDDSTAYCGNCGQAISFGKERHDASD